MSSNNKAAYTDLNATISFGGGGGGGGGGGSDRQERRNNFHRNRTRGPSLNESLDFNNSGSALDEIGTAAVVGISLSNPGGWAGAGIAAGTAAIYGDSLIGR